VLRESISFGLVLALALILGGLTLVRPAPQIKSSENDKGLHPWPAE
jgi:hypothetical protein